MTPSRRIRRHQPLTLVALSLLTAVVGLSGCGSGSSSSGSTGSGTTTATTTGTGATGGTTGTATGTGTGGTAPPAGSSVALWILIGGSSKPSNSNVYLDPELDPGEIFVLPQSPLAANTTYHCTINVVCGTESFNNTWSFTTNGLSSSSANAIAAVNALRADCGEAMLTANTALLTSTGKHAGYQAIENGTITHGETNSGDPLFVNNDFSLRISTANGGAWITGTNIEDEDIASTGGVPSIPQLWNTVYHRLPMMRSATTLIGFGDRTSAQTSYPSAHVPLASAPGSSTYGYATLDFAGNSSLPVIASQWPASGDVNVPASFDNSTESPHPIGYGNANGTSPDAGLIGPPLHETLPTAHDFVSISVGVNSP
jgi:hypothetical protein